MDDAALWRMVGALTGPGAVAGLWAEEVGGAGGGATLREALPQARFIVEVGVECWNRRRELAGLCRAAAAGLGEAVVAEAGEGGQGGAEEEDVKVLAVGVEAVRAALPDEEEEDGEQEQGMADGVGSSGTGMTEAEADAFVGAFESLLAAVEAQRAGAKAALEALWDYFKVGGCNVGLFKMISEPILISFAMTHQVPAEERNAGVLERQPTPPPAGEGKEKEKEGDETAEAGDALMRIKGPIGVVYIVSFDLNHPSLLFRWDPPTEPLSRPQLPPPPPLQPPWSARRRRARSGARSRRGWRPC
jgi:hypothetical protein